jgi:hypothetical protein
MAQVLGTYHVGFCSTNNGFCSRRTLVRLVGCGGTPSALYPLQPADNIMETLLQTYSDIFEEPRGLPPQRAHNHRIHLLPGTASIVVRPYRYPQLLKDEVERQCSNMLEQGVIRPSTSQFSSPVLLVKKTDES